MKLLSVGQYVARPNLPVFEARKEKEESLRKATCMIKALIADKSLSSDSMPTDKMLAKRLVLSMADRLPRRTGENDDEFALAIVDSVMKKFSSHFPPEVHYKWTDLNQNQLGRNI
jgi:hypothetical protein